MMKWFESLKNIKKDKLAYKEYLKRISALPSDYKFTYEKITEYMWSYSGGGDGYDMLSLHEGVLELFENSVSKGKNVIDVTGTDVAAFCDDLLKNALTYTEKRRDKLNREVMEKIAKK